MRKTKKALFTIAVVLLISLLCACIVRPEYLAQSAYIPTSPTPSPTPVPTPVPTPTPAPTPLFSVSADQPDGYFYSFLTADQKQYYHEIQQGFDAFSTSFMTHADNFDDVTIAYQSLIMDYGQYYYCYNYYFEKRPGDGRVYLVSKDDDLSQYKRELSLIKQITDPILASVPKGASEYETVKFFYEWLCNNVSYEASDRDQYISSAFIDRKTVCTGYARALQFLCNRVGIQCAIASGMGDNGSTPPESHSWDLVRIDGKYYWVDATWGDPLPAEGKAYNDEISYYFLCATDEFLFRTHTLDPFTVDLGERKHVVDYPRCTDESLLYSKRFGLFFDNYDRKTVEKGIIDYLKMRGDPYLVLQFRNNRDVTRCINEVMPTLMQKLAKNGINNYRTYSSFYYDRDGYLKIEFQP